MKKFISVFLVLLLTFSIMTPLSVISSAKTIDASSLEKLSYVCTKETSKTSTSGSTMSSSIDYTFDSKGYLTKKVETEKGMFGSSSTQTTNTYNSMGYHTKEQIKEKDSFLDGGDSTTTKTYDEKGNLTKSVKTETSFGMKETTTVTNTYDSKSNLIKTVEAYKSGSDTSTETTTKTYDESNRVIKEVYSYKDSEGYTESSSETYTFDSKGNLIKYVLTEKNSEGLNNTETTVNTFDSKGNITKAVVTEKDSDGNNSTATTTYTYDTKGNNTQVLSDYSDSDGYKKTAKTVRTFNADGNITKSVSERSESYKGEIESTVETVTYTYDSKKNLTKVVTKSTDSDGSSSTNTETYAYDSKGNVTKEVSEGTDKYADGEEEYGKISTTYTYNSKGLLTKTVYEMKDSEAVLISATTTITYDSNDNIIKSVNSYKINGLGSVTETKTFEYAPVKGALYADTENNTVYSYYNSYAYTGKAIKPGIKIETSIGYVLEQGVDYKLSYTNNTNIGTAKIKVTFVGDYEDYDAVTFPFKIVLGQVKSLKATPESNKITLEWNSVAGATGYYVYEYNASTQKYTKLKTVKTNKVTISGLKPSTSHTYAVKAYKTVDKSEITGAYSSKLTVKTTKQMPEIKLSKTSATMYLGGSMTLKATTYPANVKITWKSSDKSVATVSSSGKVTAVKNGTATITGQFTYKNKTYKASCKVTVKTPSIKLDKTSVTVAEKGSVVLKATCLPSTATVKWTSSNTSVAKVSSTGKITGVKKGTATVTASFTYGSKTYKAACKVTVKAPSITLNKSSVSLYESDSITLKSTCLPSTATVKWASSNTSVAKVSSTGKITAVKKGTATITASFTHDSKTYKATCKVTVKAPSISLNKSSVSLGESESTTLKATCLPSTATVKWASSNTSVAKVSSSGKITAVKKGTATITASFTYGSTTYKAICKVTVTDKFYNEGKKVPDFGFCYGIKPVSKTEMKTKNAICYEYNSGEIKKENFESDNLEDGFLDYYNQMLRKNGYEFYNSYDDVDSLEGYDYYATVYVNEETNQMIELKFIRFNRIQVIVYLDNI